MQKHEDESLAVAHTTVETRLHNANFYLNQVLKTYDSPNPDFGHGYNFIRRTFTENVITNLCSSLDALALQIKIIFEVNIKDRSIAFNHNHIKSEKKPNCLRCILADTDKEFADALDKLVLFKDKPIDNWYDALFEYRHQILHRHHFIFMVTVGNILYLPDDPKILTPTGKAYFDLKRKRGIFPNYTKEREIRLFSKVSIENVLAIIEFVYMYIITRKIRDNFFLEYDTKLKLK